MSDGEGFAEEEDEEVREQHDEWVRGVLEELKNKSHNAPLWDGEFRVDAPSKMAPLALKDPHAARVFEDLMPPDEFTQGGRKMSKTGGMQSNRRKSMSKQIMIVQKSKNTPNIPSQLDEEPDQNSKREAGMPTSKLIGGNIPVELPMQDLLKIQGKLNLRPDEDLLLLAEEANRNSQNEQEGLNDEALEKEVLRFPWLRSTDGDETKAYPDVSEQLTRSLVDALANAFANEEIETLYDMFQEYTFMAGEVDVIHRHDCVCCIYWVGVNPNRNIVDYCDMQAEAARIAKGDAKLFDDDGTVVYPLEGFFRWMLNYRLRHKEDWVLRAGLPERVVQYIRDKFVPYDTTGDGLKTRQVFDLLADLNQRPSSIDDQKRVIGYIQLTDVDKSGTIDFFEFLQLMRLVLEYETNTARAREMTLIKGCLFTPFEVDALRECFDQFDLKRDTALNLQQLKRLFEKGPTGGAGRQLSRQEMVDLQNILKVIEKKVQKAGAAEGSEGSCVKRQTVDFGEFVLLSRELLDNKAVDVVKQVQQMIKERSGLQKFVGRRTPYPDELKGRWELRMLDRHSHPFYRQIMGQSYAVTPRNDEKIPVPMFDPAKVPTHVRSRAKQVDVTWKLLEDIDDPVPVPDPKAKGKRGSKDMPRVNSKEALKGGAKKPGQRASIMR